MSYQFHVKGNIIFGIGAVEQLSGLIQKYDMKNVMVVYDKGGGKSSRNCRKNYWAGGTVRRRYHCI